MAASVIFRKLSMASVTPPSCGTMYLMNIYAGPSLRVEALHTKLVSAVEDPLHFGGFHPRAALALG